MSIYCIVKYGAQPNHCTTKYNAQSNYCIVKYNAQCNYCIAKYNAQSNYLVTVYPKATQPLSLSFSDQHYCWVCFVVHAREESNLLSVRSVQQCSYLQQWISSCSFQANLNSYLVSTSIVHLSMKQDQMPIMQSRQLGLLERSSGTVYSTVKRLFRTFRAITKG